MKRFRSLAYRKTLIAAMICSFWLVSSVQAETMATFTDIKGEVRLSSPMRADGKWLRVTKTGVGLYNGDRVRTVDGTAEVSFPDGSIIKVSENSDLTIEERPTRRKLFGFVDISFVNRNVKVAFGKLWANVKHSQGKWTSFESKSAVAGIKGTTVSLSVDAEGKLKFACDEGFVEIVNFDNSITLKLDSGKEVLIHAVGDGGTLVRSINGDVTIETKDGVKVDLDDKDAVIIGVKGRETTVEAAGDSAGVVKVTAGVVNASLDPDERIVITRGGQTPEKLTLVAAADNSGDVEVTVGDTSAILSGGDGVGIVSDTDLGNLTLTALAGAVSVTSNSSTTTLKPGESTPVTIPPVEKLTTTTGASSSTPPANIDTTIISPPAVEPGPVASPIVP